MMENFEFRDVVGEARNASNEARAKAKYEVDADREEFKFAVELGTSEEVARLKDELRTLLQQASAVTDAPAPTCSMGGLDAFSRNGGAGSGGAGNDGAGGDGDSIIGQRSGGE